LTLKCFAPEQVAAWIALEPQQWITADLAHVPDRGRSGRIKLSSRPGRRHLLPRINLAGSPEILYGHIVIV
jgi:hypothetical protein